MSQGEDRLTIHGFSEKEQKIALDIKKFDDDFCEREDLFARVNDCIISMQGYLNDYLNIQGIDAIKLLSFDEVLGDYLSKDFSNDFIEHLSNCAVRMCDDLGCSYKLYGVTAFSALWFTAKEDFSKAASFVIVCFQSITAMMRIRDVPKNAGKLGGRPEHPHKTEAIELAKHKWNSMEYASLNIVATAVKHQLQEKYRSAPSLPAIKKWIADAKIRPSKSLK
ncbi:hypothetical protein ACIPMZ_17910 [Scandinavium goeteborgense]|uniref:hypothetical protein n=1 Tax=Scandinavium goeteborgense TaxID=1851514 RepID=UPI003812691F